MKLQDPYILKNPPKNYKPIPNNITYFVSIETQVNNESSVSTYNLEIEYSSGNEFVLKQTNAVLNNSKIKNKIEELYTKGLAPLNNIHFFTDEKGNITTIQNYKEIVKKWQHTKEVINNEFTGDPTFVIVKQLDQTYNNEKLLNSILSNDEVLQLFFNSFINDNLIYYGESHSSSNNSSLLLSTTIPLKKKSYLTYNSPNLELNATSKLDVNDIDLALFKNKFTSTIENFDPNNLEISVETNAILDYHDLWIKKLRSEQNVTINDAYYKKKIINLQQL